MKPFIACMLAISNAFILLGCHHQGSSAPAPSDVTVVPGDGIVTISWTMAPGVDYWLFYAAASSITTDNWFTLPGDRVIRSASSPSVLALTNGTTYSFTINGRIKGGPGGPGSPSLSATPRLAGAAWVNGQTVLGSPTNLNGVTYGSQFVTVGNSAFVASSPDGKSWTNQDPTNNNANIGVAGTNLNAIAYGGNYVAVGDGGIIVLSPDAVAWSSATGAPTENLHGIAANGGFYVAVGDNKTILTSSGGTSWTTATSTPASSTLYAVTYGNGKYVAVGASGTVLTSSDAINWQPATISPSAPSATLRGVAYGNGLFVALGDGGTLLTSMDAVNWTDQTATALNLSQTPPLPSTVTINAVTYATQFIAVGGGGAIYTNVDGGNSNWISVAPAPAALNGLAHGNYGYVAVGAAGTNLAAY